MFFSQKRIKSVNCGDLFTLAIDQENHVYSWGSGLYGQLGHGKYENINLPKRIEFEDNVKVSNVSAGKQHTFILTN